MACLARSVDKVWSGEEAPLDLPWLEKSPQSKHTGSLPGPAGLRAGSHGFRGGRPH